MSDLIAAAFVRVPVPEPGPEFERRCVAHAVLHDARRWRRVGNLFRLYWLSAIVVSGAAVASTEWSALALVTGAAVLAGVAAAPVLAVGVCEASLVCFEPP